jgi:hypothetical protein
MLTIGTSPGWGQRRIDSSGLAHHKRNLQIAKVSQFHRFLSKNGDLSMMSYLDICFRAMSLRAPVTSLGCLYLCIPLDASGVCKLRQFGSAVRYIV